jgi:cytochrome c-type protein NapB
MNEPKTWRPSYPFLALCIVLLAAGVFLVGTALISGTGETVQTRDADGAGLLPVALAETPIPQEARPIAAAPGAAAAVAQPPAGRRHLDTYYERRAYPGAPPYIPHEVDDEADLGGGTCNACHFAGGYAARFEAFAPRAPHPEFLNCRQCHVVQQPVRPALAANTWVNVSGPRLGQSALPGGPPRIPHALQLRENCVACHAGAGAIAEIATTHPERGNCRQCHVAATVQTPWSRP